MLHCEEHLTCSPSVTTFAQYFGELLVRLKRKLLDPREPHEPRFGVRWPFRKTIIDKSVQMKAAMFGPACLLVLQRVNRRIPQAEVGALGVVHIFPMEDSTYSCRV